MNTLSTPQRSRFFADSFWGLGLLLAFIPYFQRWVVTPAGDLLRQGPGNLGVNILIGLVIFILASILWGGVGKWLTWLAGQSVFMHKAAFSLLAVVAIWTGALLMFDSESLAAFYGQFLLLGTGYTLAIIGTVRMKRGAALLKAGAEILRQKKRWNGVFYYILLALLLMHNAVLLWNQKGLSVAQEISAFIGRLGTHVFMVALIFFLIRLIKRTGPSFMRWGVWAITGIVPALIVGDLQISLYWNKNLLSLFNSLTDSGQLDVETELRATGLAVNTLGAYGIIVGGCLLSALVSLGLWRISKKWNMMVSPIVIIVIGVCGFVVASVEQGVGKNWKGLSSWKREHQLFDIHLAGVQPPFGYGQFTVQFVDRSVSDVPEVKVQNVLPDIHIIMVETFRADVVSEALTPTLYTFREQEAQTYQKTFSLSNGTHLSWFGFFHSRVPVFWQDGMDELAREGYQGALPLRLLKNIGYDLQIRVGCELAYKAMGPLNFGQELALADVLRQSVSETEFGGLSYPEKDQWNVEEVIGAIGRETAPTIYFTGLESPHYNYYWHEDFEAPLKDYDEPPVLSQNPDKAEIERVKNRYLNSVAWIDSLVSRYIDRLKAEGKYENSIIIITGDHGEEFQERGGWFHTSSLKPEQTEVPLMIKWPQSAGKVPSQSVASHLDVMPSVLSYLGVERDVVSKICLGNDLLKTADSEKTVIRVTAYPGQSRECLLLTRAGYEASFYWSRYWEAKEPSEMTLLRLEGPDGVVLLKSPEDYHAELLERFPDLHQFLTLQVKP